MPASGAAEPGAGGRRVVGQREMGAVFPRRQTRRGDRAHADGLRAAARDGQAARRGDHEGGRRTQRRRVDGRVPAGLGLADRQDVAAGCHDVVGQHDSISGEPPTLLECDGAADWAGVGEDDAGGIQPHARPNVCAGRPGEQDDDDRPGNARATGRATGRVATAHAWRQRTERCASRLIPMQPGRGPERNCGVALRPDVGSGTPREAGSRSGPRIRPVRASGPCPPRG
jgi:hypothetical protein